MYNLLVEGVRDLSRHTTLLQQRRVSHDPLSGIVDGSNAIFHTQYFPLLTSGSFIAYVSGSVVGVASIDYDTGTAVLASAPASQPTADYTFTPFTTRQQVSLLISGFDQMQARWDRDWTLSSGSTSYIPPTEDDPAIYVGQVDRTTDSLADPPCSGSLPFSILRTQVGFYLACCEYTYLFSQLVGTALTGIAYRERAGAQLDRTRIPGNLKLALDVAEAGLNRAMQAAQDEYYTAGEQYGDVILPEHSIGYTTLFDWHGDQYPARAGDEWRWL